MSSREALKVFISSAFEELKDERAIAREVITTMFKFTPMMFEDWGASSDAMRDTYRREVENSDIFVLILWRKYSAPTEEEFQLARELGKDILVYIKKDEDQQRESGVWGLINRIRDPEKGHIYCEFDTIIDLRDKLQENISTVLSKRLKSRDRIELDFEALLSICDAQVRSEVQYLKGSSKERGKKYIPELYVKRVEIETEFEEFLEQQDKNACVVVGEAGIGKTNLLCHLSEKLVQTRPVLFLNSLYINMPLEDYLENIFRNIQESKSDFENLVSKMNRILVEKNLDLVVFIDAINESPDPNKMKYDLADFVHKNVGKRMKFYISCRDIDWEFFLKNNDKFLAAYIQKKGVCF